jgi:hypothetical protein
MPLPYSSVPNLPLGTGTVTINSITYIVESVDLPTAAVRKIVRTDSNGDPSAFMLRADFITGTMTLQRANTTVALPEPGIVFSYDHAGAEAHYVTGAIKRVRGKDEFDTFEIEIHYLYPQS